MFQVLITTTAFTSGGCSTSSIVVKFNYESDAIAAVNNSARNNHTQKNITVSAVLLNPNPTGK